MASSSSLLALVACCAFMMIGAQASEACVTGATSCSCWNKGSGSYYPIGPDAAMSPTCADQAKAGACTTDSFVASACQVTCQPYFKPTSALYCSAAPAQVAPPPAVVPVSSPPPKAAAKAPPPKAATKAPPPKAATKAPPPKAATKAPPPKAAATKAPPPKKATTKAPPPKKAAGRKLM